MRLPGAWRRRGASMQRKWIWIVGVLQPHLVTASRTCIAGMRMATHFLRTVVERFCTWTKWKSVRCDVRELYGPWMRHWCWLGIVSTCFDPKSYCKLLGSCKWNLAADRFQSAAAVQLCFSRRRGRHVARCFKMCKETGRSDWEKRHCITNQETLWITMIHVVDFMLLEFLQSLQDKKGFESTWTYYLQIQMPRQILLGLGSPTRPTA